VAGPEDPAGETLPVALTIAGPTVTEGSTNPLDAIAGYDYENPMIGKDLLGRSCTNQRPGGMTHFELQAAVSGLTPGVSYNLYEYDFSSVSGEGAAAALAVPVADFNANAAMAARVTTFTAASSRYTQVVTTTSDKVVVLRCVPASAP
jgi:hypothetical protein